VKSAVWLFHFKNPGNSIASSPYPPPLPLRSRLEIQKSSKCSLQSPPPTMGQIGFKKSQNWVSSIRQVLLKLNQNYIVQYFGNRITNSDIKKASCASMLNTSFLGSVGLKTWTYFGTLPPGHFKKIVLNIRVISQILEIHWTETLKRWSFSHSP